MASLRCDVQNPMDLFFDPVLFLPHRRYSKFFPNSITTFVAPPSPKKSIVYSAIEQACLCRLLDDSDFGR